MKQEQKNRMDAIRQGAENMRQLNLLSDTFASVALQDTGACQYVVRKILGRADIRIIDVKSQYRLLNLTAKDAILDAFAQDSTGRLVNIEIQRRDTKDHARRTRYYGSMIDKSVLDKGTKHNEFPDVYIIYISETDLWHGGETVYPVNKILGKSAIPYDDGKHVIFVNAAVDDGSEVAKMMQYFKTADPDDMSQGELSERVHYLKTEKGGYKEMCEAAEKIYEQGIEQGEMQKAKNMTISMHKDGMAEDLIAKYANVSIDLVKNWIALSLA